MEPTDTTAEETTDTMTVEQLDADPATFDELSAAAEPAAVELTRVPDDPIGPDRADTQAEEASDVSVTDDAVVDAGDPTAAGPSGEQVGDQIDDLSELDDPSGDTPQTPESWDPAEIGLDTPGDYSNMTGLLGIDDPFEEPFSADDPESWGDSLGIGPDGTPLDDAGEFTPGDLADALTEQREDLADGIIDEADIGLPGSDAFGSGSALPDPNSFGSSDPRGTPAVTDATAGADPHVSSGDDDGVMKDDSDPDDPFTISSTDGTGGDQGPSTDGNGGDQGPNDGGTFDFSKPQSDGSIISGVPLPGPNGEAPPTEPSSTKEAIGKIWSKLGTAAGTPGGGEGGMGEQTGGTATVGIRGTPNPDAQVEAIPDGLDIVVSGAPAGPEETDPVDSLIQHQDPSDVAVDADAATALIDDLVNPLDSYTYPADDDGEIPDGIVLRGSGIEQTDPFESLIQNQGPGDDLFGSTSFGSMLESTDDQTAGGWADDGFLADDLG